MKMIHTTLLFCLLLAVIKTEVRAYSSSEPEVGLGPVAPAEDAPDSEQDPPEQEGSDYATFQQDARDYATPEQDARDYATPEQDARDYATPEQDARDYATPEQDAPDYATPEHDVAGHAATLRPPVRSPCNCSDGECSCCTGSVLQNFNMTLQRKACVKVTYEPDDFSFDVRMTYNERVLYKTTVSGKNPRPVCTPLARIIPLKMCARFSNVYMSGRNLHACLEMESFWNGVTLFRYSFDCFRIGQAGVAVVKPEDGGGLPPPPVQEVLSPDQLDYDDSARSYEESSP